MLVGNDISNAQGLIDFDTYINNSNFVIIKVTEGTGYIDSYFVVNQGKARYVGLPLGYYHYARPDLGNTPEAEADYFCKFLKNIQEGEVVVLDYEASWNGDKVDFCKRFLDRVSANLNGIKGLIYLNQSLIRNNNWKPLVDASYGLWVANYTYDPNNNNSEIGAWPFAAMQQWTNKQQVPGINGNVDGDVFFGDAAAFKKYGYKKPIHISPSPSPSLSMSPSLSPSPSESPSMSPSPSASPSPSIEIGPSKPDEVTLQELSIVIKENWTWFGKNAWYKQLKKLRDILNA